MPNLAELKVSQFRNLSSVALQPSAGVNLVYGDNGSGKTSLLEAISVLAHGRSFRTHKFRRLIKEEQAEFTVFGQLNTESQTRVKLGVGRKRNGDSQFRIDGQSANNAAQLASQLPLLIMDAHSFSLLEGSSQVRRQFFDWLVFHVKHDFKNLWRDYRVCLKQRNSLLRRDKISGSELAPWDKEMVALSRELDRHREDVLRPFLDVFAGIAKDFGFDEHGDIYLDYKNGWKGESPLEEQLSEAFERDRKLGYSTLGPHKSDIKISMGTTPAAEVLSRGQQKMLISALFVSEATVHQQLTGKNAVFLLDDMPAELDKTHLGTLAEWLNSLRSQLFVTGVEADRLSAVWPQYKELDTAVFHVKHGEVTQTNEST